MSNAASLPSLFASVPDPRQCSKVIHPLPEILLLCLLGQISGCDTWEDTEDYGNDKLPVLREFLPYKNGIPGDNTLHRVFCALDPKAFGSCFISFVASFFPTLKERLIAIDAAGCQTKIAEKIVGKGGDYVSSLKGNQATLHNDTKRLFKTANTFADSYEENAKGHGRTETRRCDILSAEDTEFLLKTKEFPHLKSVIRITATRAAKDKTTVEERYYLSSITPDAKRAEACVRSHWSIENSLHWVLDVAFNEDASRIRKDNAPFCMTIMRHIAFNLIKAALKKGESVKRLRRRAARNDEILYRILNAGNS